MFTFRCFLCYNIRRRYAGRLSAARLCLGTVGQAGISPSHAPVGAVAYAIRRFTMLTDKEQQILNYIKETIESKGYSPTVRDIRGALGIKSTSTVFSYLERLESKGFIVRETGKSRTIRVDDDGGGAPPLCLRIPIIGRVRAGLPILAEENHDGYVNFVPDRRTASDLFALRVVGSSMIEVGIMDGDIVIVEQCTTAEDGDRIVALIGDEATVKDFYREEDGFRLQPRNRDMRPIYTKELSVLGRVIASVRYY